MSVLTTVIRILAIAVGTCFVTASALDLLGLVPHSQAMPSLATRLRHSVPIGSAFATLLIPYRKVSSQRSRAILGSILLFLAAWVFYMSIDGAIRFLQGEKSWHVIPVAFAMLAVLSGNFWAFLRITGKPQTKPESRASSIC